MRRALIMLICAICVLSAILPASGEVYEQFIICQPDSWVNVRRAPRKGASVIGRYELGQKVMTDGKKRNGFLHLVNLQLENDEGWVSVGFVTGELTIRNEQCAIQSTGRVACRRSIRGTRRRWLYEGDMVMKYAWSDEWAVTDYGFIMTRFLEGEYE